jgi:hypothetical protein
MSKAELMTCSGIDKLKAGGIFDASVARGGIPAIPLAVKLYPLSLRQEEAGEAASSR